MRQGAGNAVERQLIAHHPLDVTGKRPAGDDGGEVKVEGETEGGGAPPGGDAPGLPEGAGRPRKTAG